MSTPRAGIDWVKAAPWLYTATLFVVWEAAVRAFDIPQYILPAPTVIAGAIVQYWSAIWKNSLQTLYTTLAGFVLAVVGGLALGILVGWSRFIYAGLYPLMVGFNAIPKATLVPVLALLFIGQHNFNTVMMAFMISFFPIAVSVGIGLSTLEPEYRDILRSLGASRYTIFTKIALPKTLPEFFGALKVAVTLAFIGTNLVEIVSPHGRGLGALFLSAQTNSNYPLMFAVLIALAVLGIILYYAVVYLERTFAGWAERPAT